jgi:hypothetical protein
LEEGAGALTDEDIEIIAYVTAKVNAGFQHLRGEYASPKDYGRKMLEQYIHRDNVIASIILSSANTLEPEELYKPEQFREIVSKQIREDETDKDIDGIASVFGTNSHDVSYKDMNRALHALEKEIGLTSIKGKKNIKSATSSQKIEFSGYPSVRKLPPDLFYLKKVMSNQKMTQLIVGGLKRMGLLDNLAFILEGFLHAIRYSYKEETTTYGMLKLGIKMIDDDKYRPDLSDWKKFAEVTLFLDEVRLKLMAKKMAEYMIEIPPLYYKIFLCALSTSTL